MGLDQIKPKTAARNAEATEKPSHAHMAPEEIWQNIINLRQIEGFQHEFSNDPSYLAQQHVPETLNYEIEKNFKKTRDAILLDVESKRGAELVEFCRQTMADKSQYNLALADQLEFLKRMFTAFPYELPQLIKTENDKKIIQRNVDSTLGTIVREKIGSYFLHLAADSLQTKMQKLVQTPESEQYSLSQQNEMFELSKGRFAKLSREAGMPLLLAEDGSVVSLWKERFPDTPTEDWAFYETAFSPDIRGAVQRETSVDLSHLSVREQLYFFRFAYNVDANYGEKLNAFAREFGDNGLKTFLVSSDDPALREKVFEFAGSVPKEEAQKVFEAYGKLVTGIDSMGDYLREQFGHEGGDVAQKVVERMLGRARAGLTHPHNPQHLRQF